MTFRNFRLILAALVVVGTPSSADAQGDTVPRIGATATVGIESSPISPKRAFFYSLLLPGAAQHRLGRHRAAVGLLAVEMSSIAMIRESGANVHEARRQLGDSVVVSYVDGTGNLLPNPVIERRRFEENEVTSRRSHVEDWVALLIANHLFAAADAFVAASLWDVPARVSLGGNRGRLMVIARIPW